MPATPASLQRLRVWKHFFDLCAIPRPSGNEERAREHVVAWAATHGFDAVGDSAGNTSILVPASPGHESAPRVTLQAHLDMVCVKERTSRHDFATDPIRPRVVGDWLHATGTTLGADNGIGVAFALAAAEDPSVVHGPLELLFTVDEERGLMGATKLDRKIIRGDLLLNLDSEEEDHVYVGCAGGQTSSLLREIRWTRAPAGWKSFSLRLDKLRGGHSGAEIHLGLGNANRLLARLLANILASGVSMRLGPVRGGTARNVIPATAEAAVWIPVTQAPRLRAALDAFRTEWAAERVGRDAKGRVTIEALRSHDRRALAPPDQEALLALLLELPVGVLEMSRDIPGLVETSATTAIVDVGDTAMSVVQSVRSSSPGSLDAWTKRVAALSGAKGFRVAETSSYPPWKPAPDAPIVGAYREVYRRAFKSDPHVTAIHAGLECGVITALKPGMQAISIGPDIRSPHSTSECVHIGSVDRMWKVLGSLLKRLAEGPAA